MRARGGWLEAGALYFAMVFAVAFGLGTARVLLVVPRIGELPAVLLEAPLILMVSWAASRVCIRRFGVPAAAAPRLAMGGLAFGLLMVVEMALAVLVFGQPVATYLAKFLTTAGVIGLAAQVVFGLMPLLQIRRSALR